MSSLPPWSKKTLLAINKACTKTFPQTMEWSWDAAPLRLTNTRKNMEQKVLFRLTVSCPDLLLMSDACMPAR